MILFKQNFTILYYRDIEKMKKWYEGPSIPNDEYPKCFEKCHAKFTKDHCKTLRVKDNSSEQGNDHINGNGVNSAGSEEETETACEEDPKKKLEKVSINLQKK